MRVVLRGAIDSLRTISAVFRSSFLKARSEERDCAA